MPIRPELRKFYGAIWRREIRPRILKRAQHTCEMCWAPDRHYVERIGGWWLNPMLGLWVCGQPDAAPTVHPAAQFHPSGKRRQIWIMLTIAHLNHAAGDDRDENLMALCQWCHLHMDAPHHKETRCARKDAARPLLQEGEPCLKWLSTS